jgi:hypothetical protein
MSSRIDELRAERSEFARQLSSAEFRLSNIAGTLIEDERILTAHRAMQLDAACDAAAFRAKIEAVDEEIQRLEEASNDVRLDN